MLRYCSKSNLKFTIHILSSFPECSLETAKFHRMHLAIAEAVEKTHIIFAITNKLLIDINYKQVIYISETSGPVFIKPVRITLKNTA